MAIASTAVWEVRPTNGVDTNGGGFVPGSSGTDYSQQNAAQYALTGLTTAAANAVILTSSAAAVMVGNLIQITGGTNFTVGFYQIISVSAGVSITVDRNVTTAAGAAGTGNIGGALKTITKWNSNAANGNSLYVKAEATISITSQITINNLGVGAPQLPMMIGYSATRGDNGQVTIQATAGLSSNYMFRFLYTGCGLANFIFDANNQTLTGGVEMVALGASVINCVFKNATDFAGITVDQPECTLVNCQATGNTSGCNAGFYIVQKGVTLISCVSYANACSGFQEGTANTPSGSLIGCISAKNTGAASDGFQLTPSQTTLSLFGCLAYKNGRDGFRLVVTGNQMSWKLYNCISYGNAGNDMGCASNTPASFAILGDYNAYVTKGGGYVAGAHDVTLSGDPTNNGVSNDFSLNNTSGAGASCRSAGFPGVLPVGGTGYADIGPLQHQATGSITTYVVNQNVTRFVEQET